MQSTVDKVGMFLSGLCAIQCAMLPFLLTAYAVVPDWAHFGHGWKWITAIGLIALWSFTRGWLRHQNNSILSFAVLGFGFLVAGTVMEDQVHIMLESAMFVFGGLLLVLAHWRNYRLMKCYQPENV